MNFSLKKAVAALRDTGWQAVKSEIPNQITAAKQFGVKYPKIIQFILIKEILLNLWDSTNSIFPTGVPVCLF